MKVFGKRTESGNQIESLTLTASTPEDYDFLSTLYRDIVRAEMADITLGDGQRLRSAIEGKRRSPRISVRLPVVFFWEVDGKEHRESTFTVTVSRFGCAIHSHRFFQPKIRVRLQYKDRIVEARTVYSLQDHSTKMVEVGIDFGRDYGDLWGGEL